MLISEQALIFLHSFLHSLSIFLAERTSRYYWSGQYLETTWTHSGKSLRVDLINKDGSDKQRLI